MRFVLAILFFGLTSIFADCNALGVAGNSIEFCIQITNLDDFQDVEIVCVNRGSEGSSNYLLNPYDCFNISAYSDSLTLYATTSEYLKGRKLNTIDFSQNYFCLKSGVDLNEPLRKAGNPALVAQVLEYIKIIGFTDSELVVQKTKEVVNYIDGSQTYQINQSPVDSTGSISLIFPVNMKYRTDTGIKIFPNPATSLMNIYADNDFIGNYSVKLSTFDGQTIFYEPLNKKNLNTLVKFDLNGLDPGIYLITIDFDNRVVTKKFVKTK